MEMQITRYFTSYSGVKLPFNLVGELQEHEVTNRNTCFRGLFDQHNRLCGFDKLAYGEIELSHRYVYHSNGKLNMARIIDIDGDANVLLFDETGKPLG